MSEDINFGAITEALNDKADRDLNNTPFLEADYVVESYSDDSGNWYRVYKSGWLEQGGTFTTTSTTTATSYKVNLLKPMSNSFYYVSVRPVGHNGYFGDDWTVVGERTITTFNTSTPNGGCVWYVCGLGA